MLRAAEELGIDLSPGSLRVAAGGDAAEEGEPTEGEEALEPVAEAPVDELDLDLGPVLGDEEAPPVGALDEDLRRACLRALEISRDRCRDFALERSWENSARQFIGNLSALQPSRAQRPAPVVTGQHAVRG